MTRSSAPVSLYSRPCSADQLPEGPWPLFVERGNNSCCWGPRRVGERKRNLLKQPAAKEVAQNQQHQQHQRRFLSLPRRRRAFVCLLCLPTAHTCLQVQLLLSPARLLTPMRNLGPPSSNCVCQPPPLTSVHLLTESPGRSGPGMLIKESDMLLEIWPWASLTGVFASEEQI